MSPILKVEPGGDDAERELEFELEYQGRLTTQERFEMMFRRSRELVEMLQRHGHRRPTEVLKRS